MTYCVVALPVRPIKNGRVSYCRCLQSAAGLGSLST